MDEYYFKSWFGLFVVLFVFFTLNSCMGFFKCLNIQLIHL